MTITKEQRSLGMLYDYNDHESLSDKEYSKLMKEDWDARATSGDVEVYINDQKGATEDELRKTGLNHFQGIFLPTFNAYCKVNKPVVLEYGCGIGRMTQHISSCVGKVIAVDISNENIKKCRKLTSKLKNVKASTVSGMDLVKLKDNSVDYIFSYMVFQHIGSETVIMNILAEMSRVLKVGGTMHLQFRDIPIPDNNITGNTWHGAQVGEEFIKRFTESNRFSNYKVSGRSTEKFWAVLVK